jgi:uncharacterized protein YpmS
MDIHPQFGEIRTIKDFLIRLLLIVLGVLAAVAVTQWNEQRGRNALAEQMRTRLIGEIAANSKSLTQVIDTYKATLVELDQVIKACALTSSQGKADPSLVKGVQDAKIDLRTPVISATQWQLASSNLSLRDFSIEEASVFSQIYTQQHLLESVMLQHKPGTLSALVDASLLAPDASAEQVRAGCRAAAQLRAYAGSMLGNMRSLTASYASAPKTQAAP